MSRDETSNRRALRMAQQLCKVHSVVYNCASTCYDCEYKGTGHGKKNQNPDCKQNCKTVNDTRTMME